MQYVKPDEIADELRVQLAVVYAWLRKGTLRGLKVGKYWRVRRADYQLFLESMTNVPPDKTPVLPNGQDSPHRDSTASGRRNKKRKKKRRKRATQLRGQASPSQNHGVPGVPGNVSKPP